MDPYEFLSETDNSWEFNFTLTNMKIIARVGDNTKLDNVYLQAANKHLFDQSSFR